MQLVIFSWDANFDNFEVQKAAKLKQSTKEIEILL